MSPIRIAINPTPHSVDQVAARLSGLTHGIAPQDLAQLSKAAYTAVEDDPDSLPDWID